MYSLVVRFDVRPDRILEFDALVEATIAAIRAGEPGTSTYLSMRVDDDPCARVFLEVYDDESAFAAHEAQPHVQEFLRAREPMLSAVRVERLVRTAGFDLRS